MGRDAVYSLINSYLLTFVLFAHSLNGAQVAAVTGIMIAARVFDALNDPVMGNIIERTRSKYGKFKPWLLAGGLIYTAGGVIYALKLPLFNSRHRNFGSHEIFHLFVMGGSICHFIFMYLYVA